MLYVNITREIVELKRWEKQTGVEIFGGRPSSQFYARDLPQQQIAKIPGTFMKK